MQLYFIRHAQSLNNHLEGHADYFTRRVDEPPITDVGWEQARAVAALVAGDADRHRRATEHRLTRNPWNHEGFAPTHVYCSLQRRAVETARTIGDALGMPVAGWSAIHEVGGVVHYDPQAEGFVGADGATPDELREWSPRIVLPDDALDTGWWQRKPLESRQSATARADLVYTELLERHGQTDDHVVMVSHSMFYVYLVCRILGIPFRNELWFTLNNTAITRIDIGDGEDYEPGMDAEWKRLSGLPVRITYTNRLDHLPVELVT